MIIRLKAPHSGERLFLAFVQPCLDARKNANARRDMKGNGAPFTNEKRNAYVAMWKNGTIPSRKTFQRDFPIPCAELVRFAADLGVTNEDEVWSHDMVAQFWRTAHKPNDPMCRVIAARVLSTEYPSDVVAVLNDRGERTYAVNILQIPIEEGDLVSVHKLVICERRT